MCHFPKDNTALIIDARRNELCNGADDSWPKWWRRLLVCFCAAVLGVPAWPADTLRLVANHWEPYTGEGLPWQGYASNIVTTALRRAGYSSTVTILPWARALAMTVAGQADGIVAIWSTAQRRQSIMFSDAYLSNRLVLVYLRGRALSHGGLSDLTGLRVGVGRGYDYSDSLLAANSFYREPVSHALQNLGKLGLGRVDVVLEDERIARFNLQLHGSEIPNGNDLRLSETALLVLPLYFGVSCRRADAAVIIHRFNDALRQMKSDGTFARMLP